MKKVLKLTIPLSAITSLLFLGTPSTPTWANSFNVCANRMLASGIDGDLAGIACADALYPRELSSCVQEITRETSLAPEATLQACYRVRRPQELATCVNRINAGVEFTPTEPEEANNVEGDTTILTSVLNNCRNSLLPRRYARCVIGLSDGLYTVSPQEAMDNCLDARDFPLKLFPDSQD